MKDLSKLFILCMATASLTFAGCSSDDDDTVSTYQDSEVIEFHCNNNGNSDAGDGGCAGTQDSGIEEDASMDVDSGVGGEGGEGGEGGFQGGAGDGGEGGEGGSEETCENGEDTQEMGEVNEFGPAARVTSFNFPKNAEEATAVGCNLITAKKGSQLNMLVDLAINQVESISYYMPTSINDLFTANQYNYIRLVLLATLQNWSAGQTATQAASSDLVVHFGQQNEQYSLSHFNIDPTSFTNRDPSQSPLAVMPNASLECGLLDASAETFELSVPIKGVQFNPKGEKACATGTPSVTDNGFNIENGVISGYITLETLTTFIEQAKVLYAMKCPVACANYVPPEDEPNKPCSVVCGDTIFAIMGRTTEELVTAGLAVVGGMDTYIDGDTITADCDPVVGGKNGVVCNAIGLCAFGSAESVTIDGVAAEPHWDYFNSND